MVEFVERLEKPVFAARISPHRSLSPGGRRVTLFLMTCATFGVGLPFFFAGFWPIAGFFGLDLFALFLAFFVNLRRARGFEELIVTPLELLVRSVSPQGNVLEWRFNPRWTRLEQIEDDEFGLLRLALISRGQSLVIARELSPYERATFAEALSRALSQA